MTEVSSSVPARVRVAFAHAAVQHLADQHGIDVLHIKGIATHPDVRRSEAGGTDADLLVRPAHVAALLRVLEGRGWSRLNSFDTGSPFGHAATYRHEHWGYADVHRFFPGMHDDPTASFDALWRERRQQDIAGIGCPVPAPRGQVLVQLLNLARNHGAMPDDPWVQDMLDAAASSEVLALVDEVGAHVAVDALRGRLELHRGEPDYWLWRATTTNATRSEEWLARIRAARTWRGKAALALRAPLVNRDHLATRLGHRPSRWEVTREFFDRPRRGLAEEWRVRMRGRTGR